MNKMALKRLTHSDLTFFKCYYSAQGDKPSKQKALNLNSNILVDILYPELKNATGDKLKVTLYIYGPGTEEVHILQRKILKSKGSKNWRLNGELIYSPEDNPDRYDCLRPEDIALMGFDGEPIPKTIYIDFISQGDEDDKGLYEELNNILKSPMQTVTSSQSHSDEGAHWKAGSFSNFSCFLTMTEHPSWTALESGHLPAKQAYFFSSFYSWEVCVCGGGEDFIGFS